MLMTEFEHRTDLIARNFARQSFEGVIVQDAYFLDQLITGVLQEKNVFCAFVFDASGKVIFHRHNSLDSGLSSNPEAHNKDFFVAVPSQAAEDGFAKFHQSIRENQLDVWRAVFDPEEPDMAVGYVRLGISLDDIKSLQRGQLLGYLGVLAVITIIGFPISFLISRYMSQSLVSVVEAMRNVIQNDDLSTRLNIDSIIEETNALITYFNNMTTRLEDTRAEIVYNQQRFELAINAIDAGLWDANMEIGSLVYNDRWANMLGFELDELPNEIGFWENHIHPSDYQKVTEKLNEHFEGKTDSYEAVYRLKKKSGDYVWIQANGKVVTRTKDGKPIRLIGTHIDIDERKRNEMEISRYRQRLESLVDERTSELREAQTELVNKAIEAGRAQLSAMILHNIGNAMTPVTVQVDNLLHDNSARIETYLAKSYQDLGKNMDHLTEYVNNDLRGKEIFAFLGKLIDSLNEQKKNLANSLEKISSAVSYVSEIISLQQNYAAGEKEHLQLTDINTLLDDAIKMQETAFQRRNISLNVSKVSDIPFIIIDKNKLMQVIVNLVKNAYEAIDGVDGQSNKKEIEIRSFIENQNVGFEVSDSGIGIEPEMMDRILQFGESGKGSSGFGLYYCKMFIEANKGQLIISSDGKGKGTTVSVSFSMDQNKTKAADTAKDGKGPYDKTVIEYSKKRQSDEPT